MRKRDVRFEPEVWEVEDHKGHLIDIIAEPEKISDQEFYNHLKKDSAITFTEIEKIV